MPGYCDHLVRAGEPEGATIDRVGALVDASGLRTISLSAHIDLVPAPPGHLPGYPADEAMEMLLARVRIAAGLGAGYVCTQGAFPETDEQHRLFVERIRVVADACDRAGVVLALETADGLTATGASIRALLDELAGAPIAINFDTGNLPFYSGLDPVAELAAFHEDVRHVHLKDHRGGKDVYDFPAIGDGTVDIAAVFRALKDYGYDGPISAEIEFQHPVERPDAEVVDDAVRRSLIMMRRFAAAA